MNKILLLIVTISMLSVVSAYDYDDVITQTEYDTISFDRSSVNASYTTGSRSKSIRMSCSGVTGYCIAQLNYDRWQEELQNVTITEGDGRTTYISQEPTGNYVLARENRIQSIPYLGYVRALRISQSFADDWANKIFLQFQESLVQRILNHLEVRQTAGNIIVDVGGK
jgi:hypothetical protein